MSTVQPLLLGSYLVDTADGATALDGRVRLVVLVLRAEGRELAVAMSKADAVIIAKQLEAAASQQSIVMVE